MVYNITIIFRKKSGGLRKRVTPRRQKEKRVQERTVLRWIARANGLQRGSTGTPDI